MLVIQKKKKKVSWKILVSSSVCLDRVVIFRLVNIDSCPCIRVDVSWYLEVTVGPILIVHSDLWVLDLQLCAM